MHRRSTTHKASRELAGDQRCRTGPRKPSRLRTVSPPTTHRPSRGALFAVAAVCLVRCFRRHAYIRQPEATRTRAHSAAVQGSSAEQRATGEPGLCHHCIELLSVILACHVDSACPQRKNPSRHEQAMRRQRGSHGRFLSKDEKERQAGAVAPQQPNLHGRRVVVVHDSPVHRAEGAEPLRAPPAAPEHETSRAMSMYASQPGLGMAVPQAGQLVPVASMLPC